MTAGAAGQHGLTLVELLVSMAIVAVIASLALPAYRTSVEAAQAADTRVEVRELELNIERYFQVQGFYPETLAEVGLADRLDPWGNPYQYLRLKQPAPSMRERAAARSAAATGGGSAQTAAASAAARDGASAQASGSAGSGGDAGGGNTSAGGGSASGGGNGGRGQSAGASTTAAAASSGDGESAGDGAAGDAGSSSSASAGASAGGSGDAGSGGNGQARKDHNLVPINTDFDLYSMGPDGRSAPPLTAAQSRDDIIRANNGRYIGDASGY